MLFLFAPGVSSPGTKPDLAPGVSSPGTKPDLAPGVLAGDDPLQEPLAAIDQALGTVEKLAIIRPEVTGTVEDLSGLQDAVSDHRRRNRRGG
jgi:hypothetical protein